MSTCVAFALFLPTLKFHLKGDLAFQIKLVDFFVTRPNIYVRSTVAQEKATCNGVSGREKEKGIKKGKFKHYEKIPNVRSMLSLATFLTESYSVFSASRSVSNLDNSISYFLSFASICLVACSYSASALA